MSGNGGLKQFCKRCALCGRGNIDFSHKELFRGAAPGFLRGNPAQYRILIIALEEHAVDRARKPGLASGLGNSGQAIGLGHTEMENE